MDAQRLDRLETKIDGIKDDISSFNASITERIAVLESKQTENAKDIDILFDQHRACQTNWDKRLEPLQAVRDRSRTIDMVWRTFIGLGVIAAGIGAFVR